MNKDHQKKLNHTIMKNIIKYLIIALLSFLFVSCSDDGDDDCFSCVYEKRNTGCNNNRWSEWEQKSTIIDYSANGRDPLEYCKELYQSNDVGCGAGCCVKFQHRNVRVQSCP